MRRWNGWGDDGVTTVLHDGALEFLHAQVGATTPPQDAALADALARIPASRLPAHPLLDTGAEARLRASFGQSLGDWLRLRFGRIGPVSDAVAWPESSAQVRELLDWARLVGALVIPCGGATSVVGHLRPPEGDARPVLTLMLGRMRRLLALDPLSQLARFEAGVLGPDLEAQLRAQGWMLGHYPQSFEYASLGGWVVTRSSGQQSARYGRIEAMFAGGRLETPTGTLELPTFPASAAGPDLREWVLGSEGRYGVLTEASVRISRLPEREDFVAVFLPDWAAGEAAVRELAQGKLGLSMLRLANATETLTTLRLAGHAGAIGWLERYLSLRGCQPGSKVMLMLGFSGGAAQVGAMKAQARSILRRHRGVSTGTLLGKKWQANRFKGVYLRNALWAQGYAVDTMETAVDWPRVPAMMAAMEQAGRAAFAAVGERCHAYTHLSHVYAQGSSVYTTFVFRIGPDFDAAMARWQALKTAVCEAIVQGGGTITHQHGVGKDHAPYLEAEKGAEGMAALRAMADHFDPDRLLDSGNLFGRRAI
ncbi:FAD-binding oxidoreductase [Roseateles oligotrophus]|uniref:FAD-binding oxidoreductase n=1 Tax=Roseateles oligotrophus TaxID=1769250 RepID=A0ABT2YHL6_9BURK|nr:FAD-binding oxidoreductase [Roseateles oligotrophus]MCV2369481.1 FAD-binding oxidoreductase [Roseateles oligotrophus]